MIGFEAKKSWRDTLLIIAAILFGISAPLLFFGRAAFGIAIVSSLILAVSGGDIRKSFLRVKEDLKSILGVSFLFVCFLTFPSVVFSSHIDASIGSWIGRVAVVAAAWFLMRMLQPVHKVAWNSCVFLSWAIIGYCVISVLVYPRMLSIDATLNPDIHFSLTTRLKVVGSFLIFSAMILVADANVNNGWQRYVSIVAAIGILPLLEVSNGRANVGAIIVAASVLGIVVSWKSRSKVSLGLVLLAIGCLGGGMVFWMSGIQHKMPNQFEPFLPVQLVEAGRQFIWEFTYQHVWDHPIFGYGIKTSKMLYQSATELGTLTWVEPTHPHNWVLEVWLETGLVGLVGVVGFLIYSGLIAAKDILKNGARASGLILAILTAYWFAGLFNYSFWTAWWFGLFYVPLLLAVMHRDALLAKRRDAQLQDVAG